MPAPDLSVQGSAAPVKEKQGTLNFFLIQQVGFKF
jgi:hypothetical protein